MNDIKRAFTIYGCLMLIIASIYLLLDSIEIIKWQHLVATILLMGPQFYFVVYWNLKRSVSRTMTLIILSLATILTLLVAIQIKQYHELSNSTRSHSPGRLSSLTIPILPAYCDCKSKLHSSGSVYNHIGVDECTCPNLLPNGYIQLGQEIQV